METIRLIAKAFKKMEDPNDSSSGPIQYVCYVKANSIPQEMDNWFTTNPREQKMSTNVARKITDSLAENANFHELNRGVVLSAKEVKYDTSTKELLVFFEDPEIHGNIDGGHTLRAILDGNVKHVII